MEIVIVVLLSIILVLLAVLIVVLIKNKNKKEESDFSKEDLFSNYTNQRVKIAVLTLPLEIESMTNSQIRDISRKILRIFESLDYKNNSIEYEKNSWHSWQVSILLSLYKRDMELFISNKSIFKDEIIEQSESALQNIVEKFLAKYKKEVKINLNKEILSKNRIWNGREVSILMYFLSTYKEKKS